MIFKLEDKAAELFARLVREYKGDAWEIAAELAERAARSEGRADYLQGKVYQLEGDLKRVAAKSLELSSNPSWPAPPLTDVVTVTPEVP